MKFDFAIGNPPYNSDFSESGQNGAFASPVYNSFLDSAYCVADKVEMIHPARFLFNAGSTPKEWNEKMLNDKHFKILRYEEDASTVFSNTDIKGGVAISYHDNSKDFGPITVFTKYPEMNAVINKVLPATTASITEIIYGQNKFDLETLYNEHPELKNVIGSDGKDKRFRNNIFDKIPLFTETATVQKAIPTFGVIKNKRVWRYIEAKYIDESHENLYAWKVLVARVNGRGVLEDVLSTPLVIKPGEAYTQTFIGIGAFKDKTEAYNCLKYIKTKFARTMLGVLKVTQDNSKDTWKYVPLQDFTNNSDINWNTSIKNIDKQLYKKYNLTNEEIEFIETHVKEMEE